MIHTARVLTTMWLQRWHAAREDEGATVIEYAILVLMGFLMAGAVAVAVTDAVTSRTKQIQ
jgi:Flp pilus assembly pilin Flp